MTHVPAHPSCAAFPPHSLPRASPCGSRPSGLRHEERADDAQGPAWRVCCKAGTKWLRTRSPGHQNPQEQGRGGRQGRLPNVGLAGSAQGHKEQRRTFTDPPCWRGMECVQNLCFCTHHYVLSHERERFLCKCLMSSEGHSTSACVTAHKGGPRGAWGRDPRDCWSRDSPCLVVVVGEGGLVVSAPKAPAVSY